MKSGIYTFKDDGETLRGKGTKRAAPRGRPPASSKRGRKSDNSNVSSSIHKMLLSKDDDDDDDDDDNTRRVNKPQPRVGDILHEF